MSILTLNKFTNPSPSGYKLGSVNNFLEENFYNHLVKEILDFTQSNHESWSKSKSADGQSPHKLIGGGYEGDSVQILKKALSNTNSIKFLALINELSTNEFIEYVFKNLGIEEIPKMVDVSYTESLFDFLFRRKYVYLNLKLSAYPPNSGIALHRDNQRKVIGMLLYFGFSDSIERKKGGTQFYSDHEASENWSESQENHKFSESEMLKLCLDKEPVGNSFAAFEINNRSWHGVKSYQDKNENLHRINLQINFMRVQKHSFMNKLAKRIFSWVK